ncbi:MAG: hypothetical protein KC431_29000, partial [Myxococcales bacterium]|nr:hypothetical protein [Myxococcales bacterium]
MSDSIRIFNIEIADGNNNKPTWTYHDGQGSSLDISDGALHADFSNSRVVVNNDESAPRDLGESTSSRPFDLARLIVANKSSKNQTVSLGKGTSEALSVTLKVASTITVNAVIDHDFDNTAEIGMSIAGDPIFSTKPAKPPTVKPRPATAEFSPEQSMIWDGTSWTPQEFNGRSGGTVEIKNESGRIAVMTLANGPGESSNIEFMVNNGSSLVVTFGSDFQMVDGRVSTRGQSATLNVYES